MGQWGNSSFACDNCFDCLDEFTKDSSKISQREITACINKNWERTPNGYEENYQPDYDLLGIISYALIKGKRVNVEKLKSFLPRAEYFFKSRTISIQGWGDVYARQEAVEREIKLIKFAIKHNGTCTKKFLIKVYGKGYMEKEIWNV